MKAPEFPSKPADILQIARLRSQLAESQQRERVLLATAEKNKQLLDSEANTLSKTDSDRLTKAENDLDWIRRIGRTWLKYLAIATGVSLLLDIEDAIALIKALID